EQSYGKLKQWLLNRLTLGKGVLCGLRVSVDGNRVCVDPGVAIDGLGREIIVPVRACIDPLAVDDGCCGEHAPPPPPTPAPPRDDVPPGRDPTGRPIDGPASVGRDEHETAGAAAPPRPTSGVFTLWVCYRECLADPQAVLLSDCNTRDHCAAGTIVETFCLKATPGLPPLQGDPQWCAKLWGPPATRPAPGARDAEHRAEYMHGMAGLSADDLTAIRETLQSRKHLLCELFDDDCTPPEGDPCVPLAVIIAREGRLIVEECLVRPRIYSNAVLLDLILCLAEKIDECCNGHQPPPPPAELMHVRSVEFLSRRDGAETVVASMQTPLTETPVPIGQRPNAIRIRFSKPFAQNQHKPATHGPNDANPTRRNVQIIPDDHLNNLTYVPGTVQIEAPDTIRFDLWRESPFVRGDGGWQKGRYRLFLRGTEPAANQPALTDLAGKALDGEPIAPAAGVISGNGTAGGDFSAFFVVGGRETPRETMRVKSVEFLAGDRVVATMQSPLEVTRVAERLSTIRIRFSQPFGQDATHKPTTHALNDPDFRSHNLQVLLEPEDARRRGVEFVPGSLVFESADTIRFEVARGSRVVDPRGGWPSGTTHCRLYLRGNDDAANNRPALADQNGAALDGEPTAPANGMISGDGTAGGDFIARFNVEMG
ncbi:MAG: hypothetical protein ACJ8LN_00750, partial [Sulfurifustis sp.]